jgi:hypothetical protein
MLLDFFFDFGYHLLTFIVNGKATGAAKRGGFSVFFLLLVAQVAFAKNSKKVSLKRTVFAIKITPPPAGFGGLAAYMRVRLGTMK